MRDLLSKINKIVNALSTLIPTLLEVLEDFADDGKRNHSNKRPQ
jgi:hypothetical protein